MTTSFPPIAFVTPWNPSYAQQSARHPGPPEYISPPYYCKNTGTLRLVFNTYDTIEGVIIPCVSGLKPKFKVIPLMHFKGDLRECYLSLGYDSAILTGGAPPVQMLYYSWPEFRGRHPLGSPNFPIVKLGKKNRKKEKSYAFDDDGFRRVVVESPDEILIYDLAKFKNCT